MSEQNANELAVRIVDSLKLNIVTVEMLKTNPELKPFFDPSYNPDKAGTASLTEDIRLQGVLQPVTVTIINGKPVVVMGRERVRSCQHLSTEGWTHPGSNIVGGVPIIVKDFSEAGAARAIVAENVLRKNLTWSQKAASVKGFKESYNLSFEECAVLLNVSHQTVRDMIAIHNSATPQLLKAIDGGANGKAITPTAAMQLLRSSKSEDGKTIDKVKLNENLKELLTEAQARGDKKISVAGAGARNNKKNTSLSMAQVRVLAAAAGTPHEYACLLRFIAGDLSLNDAKGIALAAGGDLSWLVTPVITKESKKASKKKTAEAKVAAKTESKKPLAPVTDETMDAIFG